MMVNRPGLGERHEAQFIDDEQFVGSDLFLKSQQLLLVARLDQLADQRGGSGEAKPKRSGFSVPLPIPISAVRSCICKRFQIPRSLSGEVR
jgi:hypothetical protein